MRVGCHLRACLLQAEASEQKIYVFALWATFRALYDPLRLVEEIAIIDQMLGGRMELGLVRGSISIF